MTTQEAKWKSIARDKQAKREAAIPSEWRLKSLPDADRTNLMNIPRDCGILTSTELDLTENYDATALVKMLANGEVKSEDLTRAFCKRAAVAHQIVSLSYSGSLTIL